MNLECTLTLKEQTTSCSMVVMWVCRIWRCKHSTAEIFLVICPRRLPDRILIIPNSPESLTSTSANQDLLSAVWSWWSSVGGRINGGGCCSWWWWWTDSRHWRSCCSSLTNSIAPPTIEAWSPYITKIMFLIYVSLKLFNFGDKNRK